MDTSRRSFLFGLSGVVAAGLVLRPQEIVMPLVEPIRLKADFPGLSTRFYTSIAVEGLDKATHITARRRDSDAPLLTMSIGAGRVFYWMATDKRSRLIGTDANPLVIDIETESDMQPKFALTYDCASVGYVETHEGFILSRLAA